MEEFKYLFATKLTRKLCIKFTEQWEENMVNYLIDKDYELRPATEMNYKNQRDDEGDGCECYLLDKNLKHFDVGTY